MILLKEVWQFVTPPVCYALATKMIARLASSVQSDRNCHTERSSSNTSFAWWQTVVMTSKVILVDKFIKTWQIFQPPNESLNQEVIAQVYCCSLHLPSYWLSEPNTSPDSTSTLGLKHTVSGQIGPVCWDISIYFRSSKVHRNSCTCKVSSLLAPFSPQTHFSSRRHAFVQASHVAHPLSRGQAGQTLEDSNNSLE